MNHKRLSYWLSKGLYLAGVVMLVMGWVFMRNAPYAQADSTIIDFEGYSVGTVHGQDGWSKTGPYDVAIVSNSYGYGSFGGKSLRISNAVTSGSFGDWAFSKSLADEAGETSADNGGYSGGTRQPYFEAQWDIASTTPGAEQPGLQISAAPDRGDGARMSFLRFNDTSTGLKVTFVDYQQSVGDFVLTEIATGLDRFVPHNIRLQIYFVDGPANDVVYVYIDGTLIHTGTSWEDYFRDAEVNPTRPVDSMLFQARSGAGTAPLTLGNGFLIDNLTLFSGPIPVVQCTTDCYVDAVNGANANGGTSWADAKQTIQAAVNQVDASGTVYVAAGTYIEQVTITKDLHLIGAGVGLSIIAAPATLPTSSNATSAIVLINGNSVDAELTGFTVTGPGPSGCGSIRAGIYVYDGANADIHHNTIQDVRDSTFSGCQNGIAIAVGRQAWTTTGTATINNNTIVGYQKGGIVVDNTGSNATITNNTVTGAGTTNITAQNGIQISRGATAILSGNTVTGNSFHLVGNTWDWGAAGILLYQAGAVNLSGGNAVSGNDQNLYIDSATAVTVGADAFGPSTAPLYSGYEVINYTGLALNLTSATFPGESNNCEIEKRIWHGVDDTVSGLVTWVAGNLYVASPESKIQNAVDKATAGNTVNVCAGTYIENVTIPKSITLKGAEFDVNVSGRTAASLSEATIQGLVTVDASDVDINGFTLTNPGQPYALYVKNYTPSHSSINITYNIIDNVGSPSLASNVHAIFVNRGPDAVTIAHNRFNNIKASIRSASAIGVLDSVSTDSSTGLLIQDNTFMDIASVTKGAYGIILNNAAGAPGAQIKDNTFSGLNGGWTHAIGLEGPTPNAIVTGNIFNSLTALSADKAAILFEKNSVGGTVTVANNQFNGNTYYGVAIHPNDLPGGTNGYDYTVIAESNWWDTASGPGTVGPGTGTLVGPNVDFTPWLCVGTDTSTDPGFQPTGQTDCTAPVVSGVSVAPTPVYLNASTTVNAVADDSTTGNSNIASAEYNLNGTGWLPMTAADAAFDEPTEAVNATFTASTFSANQVCVRATDVGGNVSAATCSTFAVTYKFTGFFQPIDMNAVNIAKAGQSIPAKWRLTDANNVPISDPASFVGLYSYSVSCSDFSGTPPDDIETYSGSSGLQYLGDGYWQFNWKTPKSYANTCRTMYVQFQGGLKSPEVDFKFKP